VKPALMLALGGPLFVSIMACGGTAPATPSLSASPTLAGTWTGTGTDPQGAETFQWSVVQNGDAISGTAVMNSTNPTDGSCGSCHKQKNGTLSGTMSNGALTLTLSFPSGGTDITPLCGLTMNTSATSVAESQITATYTGTTTCEGPITDGTFVMHR
jgi:hypothetical protein